MSVRKFGIGVLIMGLAITASAKDAVRNALPAGKIQPPGTHVKAKIGSRTAARTRRFLQVGVASWYGSHFQGHTTAAGERFDMNLMTCAHPTLPMGTWLRVTNLKNRRTAFVRVNDRGPLLEGRIVDLSYAAARALALGGVGRVSLEAVRDGDPMLAMALVAQVQFPVLFNPLAP
jgi:rare lipoprotein A